MNKRIQVLKYIISDFLTACASWIIFFIFRKLFIEPLRFGYEIPLEFDNKFYLGLLIIPVLWIFLYYLSGYYKNIYRKSVIQDIALTFIQIMTGVVIIFFFLILDDYVSSYKNYYLLFAVLFSLQFFLTLTSRLILTSRVRSLIHKRKIGFKTIIAGGDEHALEIFNELENKKKSSGNYIIGFVGTREKEDYLLSKYIPMIGMISNLDKVVENYQVEEVILALETDEYETINTIINKLGLFNVCIKLSPGMQNILSGRFKMEHLYGSSLVQIVPFMMPAWQENIKQLMDILGSVFALLILSPLIVFIIAGIKISSPGPVIYSHERIGRYGKSFKFYKFRSMRDDAEPSGPELSSKNDKRLTNFGKFLRRYRLDEIPNFFNVLKGDLSLVGPRPEREYYISQILKKAPHYIHLQKVKPGITSWGQVKYGYAENVDQMIRRLNYDIMYIQNMSLFTDFKILLHTLLTILKGRGI